MKISKKIVYTYLILAFLFVFTLFSWAIYNYKYVVYQNKKLHCTQSGNRWNSYENYCVCKKGLLHDRDGYCRPCIEGYRYNSSLEACILDKPEMSIKRYLEIYTEDTISNWCGVPRLDYSDGEDPYNGYCLGL